MAVPNGLDPTFENVKAKKLVLSQAAKVTSGAGNLHPAESGALFLFDAAASCVITLPAAEKGIYYDFIVQTQLTATGDFHKVICTSGDYLLGGALMITSTEWEIENKGVSFWRADGGTDVAITLNAGTKGGILGTQFRVAAVSTSVWAITGLLVGSTPIASPFATS